jgi:hypothetical protein
MTKHYHMPETSKTVVLKSHLFLSLIYFFVYLFVLRQGLTMQPRPASDSQSFCLSLPGAGITGVHHQGLLWQAGILLKAKLITLLMHSSCHHTPRGAQRWICLPLSLSTHHKHVCHSLPAFQSLTSNFSANPDPFLPVSPLHLPPCLLSVPCLSFPILLHQECDPCLLPEEAPWGCSLCGLLLAPHMGALLEGSTVRTWPGPQDSWALVSPGPWETWSDKQFKET